MENPTGDVRECLLAARAGMREIKRLLSQPSAEMADQAVIILRDVEIQLGCVAALLKNNGNGTRPALEIRTEVEDLQEEVAVLARFLARADQMLAGWLQGVRTRRGGYTERGQAAPLVLVKKLTVEG
ncbi:MAG TPA: hypothetical protein VMH80_02995 [Bryobacteraceae bacterium]|nr:hypothetical protein [Bryobacteraceae bacterium]